MKDFYKILVLVGTVLLAYLVPLENMRVEAAVLQSFWSLQDFIQSRFLWHLLPAILVSGLLLAFVPQDRFAEVLSKKKVLWYLAALVVVLLFPIDSCMVVFPAIALYRLGASVGTVAVLLFAGPAVSFEAFADLVFIQCDEFEFAFLHLVSVCSISLLTGALLDCLFPKSKEEVAGQEVTSAEKPLKENILLRWLKNSLNLSYLCLPIFVGVALAAFVLGSPFGDSGLIPKGIITPFVTGSAFVSSVVASITGGVPWFLLENVTSYSTTSLISDWTADAKIAYLLAGPALSLPGAFALIASLGVRRSLAYVTAVLVLVIATGLVFGTFVCGC